MVTGEVLQVQSYPTRAGVSLARFDKKMNYKKIRALYRVMGGKMKATLMGRVVKKGGKQEKNLANKNSSMDT